MLTGRLSGKVALITGGGAGIGRAAAHLFAAEGAAVGVLDVDRVAATRVADELTAKGARAIAVAANVSVDVEVCAAVRTLVESLGPVNVLYNNAGVASTGAVDVADEDDWDRCMAINAKGTFLASRAVLPSMLAAGGGSIINQASVAAIVGVANFAAYCAAKGAVLALTRSMSVDLAPRGVRVNVIAPGTVYTPLMEPLLRARGDGDLERGLAMTLVKYPIGRLAQPEDIAAAALYLAGSESAFVTGSVLTVDGGMTSQ
ncbi:SDR family NAD(P)-dependent oxidoreductase [Nocardioides sp. CPCC 206347]